MEAYPAGPSQVPNFFVICFYHRMTMQKTNASNLETWRCQNSSRLIRASLKSDANLNHQKQYMSYRL